MPAQKKKTGKARKAANLQKARRGANLQKRGKSADSEKARRRSGKARRGSGKESAGRWFERLVKLQGRLRAPNGCPWDIEQTHLTLRTYLIEEAYEVLEALESGDDAKFAEELGDLLLQVVF